MYVINKVATGERIRVMIEEKGMTSPQVARQIGVLPNALYGWYSGKMVPRAAQLLNLSVVLECDIEDLLVAKWVDDPEGEL